MVELQVKEFISREFGVVVISSGSDSEAYKMVDNNFDKEINRITKRAAQESGKEMAEKKASKREAQRITKAESKASPKHNESSSYIVGIIAKLQYEGDNVPTKEQLAEDLGQNIMKWVNQREFYAIGHKEAVPKLISIDVDVR